MSKNVDGTAFWGFALYAYLIIAQVMALYYWWDYSQNNGFISTMILGPFISEFKGLLWIITIFI